MANKNQVTEAPKDDQPSGVRERALATVGAPGGFKIDGLEFVVVKQVTRAVLSQEDDKPYAVKITSEISQAPSESTGKRERKARLKKDENGNPLPPESEEEKQKPPMICDITNLVTGELQTLVVNSSLQDELEENFPDLAYVGKCFAFKSKLMPTKDRARKFRLYTLFEIAEPKMPGQKLESVQQVA